MKVNKKTKSKKLAIMSVLSLLTQSSLGFFGSDAAILIAQDAVNGALVLSTVKDDIVSLNENGLTFSEVENYVLKHSEEAAKLRGEYDKWDREAERLKLMDRYNKKASKTTTGLKRIKSLMTHVCSLSPDSCSAMVQYENVNLQAETNKNLESVIDILKYQELKKETKELELLNTRVETLEAINKAPEEMFKKMNKNLERLESFFKKK